MDILEAVKPRVFLWCLPRTCSTVVAKCMSSVEGVQVWMEPYNICASNRILGDTNVIRGNPGLLNFARRFGEAQDRVSQGKSPFTGGKLSSAISFNYDWVQSELEKDVPGKPVQFIKDLPLGIDGHYDKLPREVTCVHTFLIRHPYRSLPAIRDYVMNIFGHDGDAASFDMSVGNPFIEERDQLHQLWKHVVENLDPSTIVIDADELLQQPEVILPKYFNALGIPWDAKYLSWNSSTETVKGWRGAVEHCEWGNSNGVFDEAFASSCFIKPQSKTPPSKDALTPDLMKYVDIVMPGYEEMYNARLKAS